MKKWKAFIIGAIQKIWVQFSVFASSLWLLFVHLEINRHLKDMIAGLHYWRKSDTYAQISNYYYNGLNFFDHSIYYNQLETTGKAVAEFPLFYYIVAIQQIIFGHHEIIAKINWVILLFLGLFAVFKIAFHFFNHFGLSLLVAFILFISPVFTFYTLDYLPDPIALNLSFIGCWLLVKHTSNQRRKTLVFAIIILGIAGMTKPFFLIPYLAFILLTIVNQLFLKRERIPDFNWLYLIPLFMITSWFIYTNWYNTSVATDYFLSKPRPIWTYNAEEIQRTLDRINQKWLKFYILPNYLWAFISIAFINLVWWTKKNTLISLYYLFSTFGCLLFWLLFFNMFEDHDYYIFPLLFIIPLTLGIFIYKLTQLKLFADNRWKHGLSISLLVTFFLGLNTIWALNQNRRKSPEITSNYLFENYQGLESTLIKHGINKETLIVAFSDKSPNFALSLLDRKGWSGFQTMTFHWDLSVLMERGADYLIINKRAPVLYDSVSIEGYLNYELEDTNDILIYDLKPYK